MLVCNLTYLTGITAKKVIISSERITLTKFIAYVSIN